MKHKKELLRSLWVSPIDPKPRRNQSKEPEEGYFVFWGSGTFNPKTTAPGRFYVRKSSELENLGLNPAILGLGFFGFGV